MPITDVLAGSPIGGTDWAAAQLAMWTWVVNAVGSIANVPVVVVWDQQDAPRPPSPAVQLRISNIAETGKTWLDTDPNPLTFTAKTITAINTGTDVLTSVAHGLNTGDGPFQITTTGTFPGGLATLTNYWFVKIDADTFQLATTYAHTGGQQPLGALNPVTFIDITSAGTGTIKINSTADSESAGAEILGKARCLLRVSLELSCHSVDGVGMNMATSLLQRVRLRRAWQSQQDLLQSANVGLMSVDRVRALQGVRDAVLFEPRATLDVHFSVPCEESEAMTIISTFEITNLLTNQMFTVGP